MYEVEEKYVSPRFLSSSTVVGTTDKIIEIKKIIMAAYHGFFLPASIQALFDINVVKNNLMFCFISEVYVINILSNLKLKNLKDYLFDALYMLRFNSQMGSI